MAFENVLPVLRTPAIAKSELYVHHIDVPADREADTPLVAFSCDGVILSHTDVKASGITNADLYKTALANLASRRGSWRVEHLAGGFMGIGKKTAQIMSLVHEYAAEHILLDGFIDEVERMIPKVTFFAPRRGTLRCAAPQFVAREREMAKVSFEKSEKALAAGKAGNATPVCPFELLRAPIVGQVFALGARFAGTDEPYVPQTGPRRAITRSS